MDNYPAHLAPRFDEGGGVETPFEEWWPRVKDNFPTVPEEVAKEWLHRHWHHSPFGWLVSADYKFERVTWPSSILLSIRCGINNFRDDPSSMIAQGRESIGAGSWLTKYVEAHGDFPSPPIILDNGDGHLLPPHGDPNYFPPTMIVVEGHTRFSLGYYLHSLGKMQRGLEFYVMSRTG